MGGNGALKFAFKYPDLFGSVVAYAPALVDGDWMAANDTDFLKTMFAGDKDRYQRETAAEGEEPSARHRSAHGGIHLVTSM